MAISGRLYRLEAAAVAVIISLLSFNSRAGEPGQTAERRVQLDLGMGGLVGFASNVCEQDYDVIGCQMGMYMLNLAAGGHYRIHRRIALGGLASFAWEPLYETRTLLMWRAAASGRFYPLAGRVTDMWLGLEAGVAGAHAKLPQTSGTGEESTVTDMQIGPELGASLGFDFALDRNFALGFSTSALWLIFGDSTSDGAASRLDLDRAVWITLGLHVRFSFPV